MNKGVKIETPEERMDTQQKMQQQIDELQQQLLVALTQINVLGQGMALLILNGGGA
ncbi:MAG TPA: hypothetical protein VN426_06070 [Syntrophomonadaceae bacterium]|nr:hypothetical protein [Syntrophomonadaceae bacterium]